jgi:hypothetical protein
MPVLVCQGLKEEAFVVGRMHYPWYVEMQDYISDGERSRIALQYGTLLSTSMCNNSTNFYTNRPAKLHDC